jgi:hypothetical protein
MAADKETRKAKRLPATYVLWSLPVYAAVVVLAYLNWHARMENYMAPIRKAKQLREKLFYVDFGAEEFEHMHFDKRLATLQDRLRERIQSETASGARISVREGILVADPYAEDAMLKYFNDFLGYAYSLGVTKAVFELGDLPRCDRLEMSLVTDEHRDALLKGLGAVSVEVSQKALKVGSKVLVDTDIWFMWDRHEEIEKLLNSSQAGLILLSVSDLLWYRHFSALPEALAKSGKEVALVIDEDFPDGKYMLAFDAAQQPAIPFRIGPANFGAGELWDSVVSIGTDSEKRLSLMPGYGIMREDMELFFSQLEKTPAKQVKLLYPIDLGRSYNTKSFPVAQWKLHALSLFPAQPGEDRK